MRKLKCFMALHHASPKRTEQVVASERGPPRHLHVCNFSNQFLVSCDTSQKAVSRRGACDLRVLHPLLHTCPISSHVEFSCCATRTNREVHSETLLHQTKQSKINYNEKHQTQVFSETFRKYKIRGSSSKTAHEICKMWQTPEKNSRCKGQGTL